MQGAVTSRDASGAYFVLGSVRPRSDTPPRTASRRRRSWRPHGEESYRSVKDAGKLLVLSLCTMTSLAARVAHTEHERFMLTVCLSTIGFLVSSGRSLRTSLDPFALPGSSLSVVPAGVGTVTSVADTDASADVGEAGTSVSRAVREEHRARLLSVVSEELRAPIAAIMTAAEIITKHKSVHPEVVDRFGTAIGCEGERLMRLLDDYGDLSRMDAGQDAWIDLEIDAATVVADVLAGLERTASVRRVQLIDAVEPDLPPVRVDPRRLGQLLTNLAYKAIVRTAEGGSVTVRVSLREGEMRFGVEDMSGPVSAEQAGAILDRNSVGLLLSRAIVRHYDGRMWTETDDTHGTGVWFAFPVFRRSALAPA